ncbi:hypothetical protein WJX77_009055 [Trebouxia sp. C0004]
MMADFASPTAKKQSPMQRPGDQPSPRLGHSTTAIKHTLYVFGGRTGADLVDCAVGDIHAFDTKKLDWSAVGAVGTPAPRSFHAAAGDDTNLYIFGGCGAQGRLNDLHRFDSTTGSWEALPSKTSVQPRGGASLLVYKSSLFLIGGFNGTELVFLPAASCLKGLQMIGLLCLVGKLIPLIWVTKGLGVMLMRCLAWIQII